MSIEHIESSKRFILDAARAAGRTSALILGCGRCAEIPVDSLGQRFSRLRFVDADNDALTAVATRYPDDRGRYEYHRADLTGMIDWIRDEARRIALRDVTPDLMIEQIADRVLSHAPELWSPPSGERFDLVVCSGVLTQLQAKVRAAADQAFGEKFPSQSRLFHSHRAWRRAAWHMARRLEDAFVVHLADLTASNGVICLSDTVRVNWLIEAAAGTFTTEGTWIATRTARLTDYLSPSVEIIAQDQWTWLRQQPEGPYWGRLYDVQAVAYR
jgi:hypothetical protein